MNQYSSALAYTNSRPSVVTIGTFDGVHIGHKAILERLVSTGKNEGLDSVLLTFFPHPRMVLQQDNAIQLINTLDEKKQLLKAIGLDHLVVHPFTKEFSRLTAMEYVRDILVNRLKAKKIIIGYDHRFGRNRTANIEDLREFGQTYEFEVEEISAQELNEVAVSSTKVRKALEMGDIETANSYLGYAYMLNGTVVRGKALGRTIDFPTANLKVESKYKLIPPKGVYVVQSYWNGQRLFGMTSIGTNPTVGGTQRTIETYFLNFNEDLYDQPLCIEFLIRIRDEATFDSTEALKSAIAKDQQFTLAYLKSHA